LKNKDFVVKNNILHVLATEVHNTHSFKYRLNSNFKSHKKNPEIESIWTV